MLKEANIVHYGRLGMLNYELNVKDLVLPKS